MNYRMSRSKLMLFMMALGLMLSACGADESGPAAAKIGEKLPSFKMQTLGGEVMDSHELFAGKVVVLNLWATWCPPCRKEMPDLERLSKLMPKDKFLVAGISVDGSVDVVKTFVEEQGVTFPMFWDEGGSAIANPIFKAFRYPETFVINAEGVLVEKVAGAFPWASPELIAILKGIQKTGNIPAADGAAAN